MVRTLEELPFEECDICLEKIRVCLYRPERWSHVCVWMKRENDEKKKINLLSYQKKLIFHLTTQPFQVSYSCILFVYVFVVVVDCVLSVFVARP
jgi:hypothetical protein